MKIHKIELVNFMSHDETTIVLPDTGFVSITGKNGAGKSAFVEAIAMGLWGKSLRPKWTPWRKDQHGRVTIQVGNLEVVRTWTGKSKRLKWRHAEEEWSTFETPTKAQNALNSYVGDFDVWKRTSVFSSSDASLFTMATDLERKKLLESLLGLSWFDDALKLCRVDLNATRRAMSRIEGEMNQLKLAADVAKDGERAAREFLESDEGPTDTDEADAKYQKLDAQKDKADEQLQAINRKVREMQNQLRDSEREVESLRDKIESMGDKCFSCGQKISATIKKSMAKQLKDLDDNHTDLKDELSGELEDLEDEARSLFQMREEIAEELNEVKAIFRDARIAEKQRAKYEQALANAESRVKEVFDKCFDLEEQLDDKQTEVAELEDVEKILGVRGVRAQVLGSVLGSIETIANLWLSRFHDELEISLKEYSESKTGNTTDAISLEVSGASDESGTYLGASGGERRRIDIALLFALAEVAIGSKVQNGMTFLFFDEVFDSLDDDGVAVVINSLREISDEMQVMVVSHAHVEQMDNMCDLALRVDNGKVTTNE